MSMPPANIEASELFRLLSSTPKPHKILPFPRKDPAGNDLEFAMFILNQNEQQVATVNAERRARKFLKENFPKSGEYTQAYTDLFNNLRSQELLWLACKDVVNTTRPLFPSPQSIGDYLTTDEVAVLVNHYIHTQYELGPLISDLTQEEMDAWIKRLAEGGESAPYFLSSLTWEATKTLIVYLASQSLKSQTDRSSASSQQENDSQTES